MTYKDIEQVNAEMKRTPIRGKQYAEVPQRVAAFRKLYPEGSIRTEIVHIDDGLVVMRATVGDGSVILATGTAYEREGSSNINNTSFIENCETSAVGRALGFLGLGSEASIATYEEVATAKMQQEEKATPFQLSVLKSKYTGDNEARLFQEQGITKWEDLPALKAGELLRKLALLDKGKE